MRQRLKRFYQKRIIPRIRQNFSYQNVHQIPRIRKIVINRGMGGAGQNVKLLEVSLAELTTIASQKGVLTRARKSIAGFKIREKMPIGISVKLRSERIYAFYDRLVNLALPRIRDFQGVSLNFDGQGNFTMGLVEQLMFPEIFYDQIDQVVGIDISIVTTAHTDEEGLSLLKLIGIPWDLEKIL